MTNGEKIKEIFPEAEIIPQYISDVGLIGYDVCIDGETYFSKDWWHMEYQEPCKDWHDVPSDEMTLEQARQAVKDLRKKLAEYLEQEEDIFDKIRADLHHDAEMHEDGNWYLMDKWVDDILDKYKTESEDKE